MKTLLLMRHAKSSHAEASVDDHDRPLNERGRQDAPKIGERLAASQLMPQKVLASDALRTRQTAQEVARAAGYTGQIDYLGSLYGANRSAYLDALRELPDDVKTALVIGHNPEIEGLVDSLSGQAVEMPTSALAHLSLAIDRWADVPGKARAELVSVWRPRDE